MKLFEWLSKYDSYYFILGRSLLGLYFFLPGLLKIFDYSGTQSLMALKGIPLYELALPLTIFIQILGGMLLILGQNLRITALSLFFLTILINIFIHNFINNICHLK